MHVSHTCTHTHHSKAESSEAVPYAPDENVETIGGAYVDVERLSSAMKRGRTASGKSRVPESPFRPDVSASLSSNVGGTEKGDTISSAPVHIIHSL